MSDSLQPSGLYSPWNSPGKNTGVGSLSLLQGIFPTTGIKLRSLTLQADSLPAEPQGKPKNTRVSSLSLLQQIFPTQELNQNLLHCRQVLYQLSYQGNPVNIQDWFPLVLTGLISLQSKRLSVFSNTTVWKHQFFGPQPSLWSDSHIHMTTGKTIAFTDLCQQSNVFAF